MLLSVKSFDAQIDDSISASIKRSSTGNPFGCVKIRLDPSCQNERSTQGNGTDP